jgi:hypothetical protein
VDPDRAAFLVARSTPLNVRQAIDLLVKSNVIARVAIEGFKNMEKEGRVSPEFVRDFEEHISDRRIGRSRIPVDV